LKKKLKLSEPKELLYSAIKCSDGTVLHSKYRTDLQSHTDTKTGKYYSIQGGNSYQLLNDNAIKYCKNISIYDDGKHETRRKYLKWGINYDIDNNPLPKTIWKSIMDLETDHITNILEGDYYGNDFIADVLEEELLCRKI
jgi:hypothetical protein